MGIEAGFNGAALTGARKSSGDASHAAHAFASMGPRSRERGNVVRASRCDVRPLASMGPRSRERGNEAAEKAAEKSHEASMGPRSRERGNKPQPGVLPVAQRQLQWGRAHVSAEIKGLFHGLQPRLASMGPRSRERGNSLHKLLA